MSKTLIIMKKKKFNPTSMPPLSGFWTCIVHPITKINCGIITLHSRYHTSLLFRDTMNINM